MKVLGTKVGAILSVSLALSAQAARGEGVQIYTGENGWAAAEAPRKEESGGLFDAIFGQGKLGGTDVRALAQDFLSRNAALLHTDEQSEWTPADTQTSATLQTQRLRKSWNGLPVQGGDAVVALSQGQIAFANADATDLSRLSAEPRIGAEEARAIAFASYRGQAARASEPKLMVLLLGQGRARRAELAYEVTVTDRDQLSSDIHYVSATTGAELQATTNVQTLSNREVVAGNGDETDWEIVQGSDLSAWKTVYADAGCEGRSSDYMVSVNLSGGLEGDRGLATAGGGKLPTACYQAEPRVQESALAAFHNSGMVYDYYSQVHNRNSIDNKGLTLKSVVNFVGAAFANAAWYNDKNVMLYGVGDEKTQNDFALPLDVAAHEITHGMTARTANLEYVSESGALNESYSDVFGKLVAYRNGKPVDWKIGGELFKDGKTFIRDMENPKIAHVRDQKYQGTICHRFNDFCGVHSNSGIPNRAAVLISRKIGNDKLGALYFLTLTQLLRASSDFREARAQTEAACGKLYGAGSSDCRAVGEAFDNVGVGSGPGV